MTLEVGKQVPDFTLQNQKGEEVTLSDFKGKKCYSLFLSKRYDTRLYESGMWLS